MKTRFAMLHCLFPSQQRVCSKYNYYDRVVSIIGGYLGICYVVMALHLRSGDFVQDRRRSFRNTEKDEYN